MAFGSLFKQFRENPFIRPFGHLQQGSIEERDLLRKNGVEGEELFNISKGNNQRDFINMLMAAAAATGGGAGAMGGGGGGGGAAAGGQGGGFMANLGKAQKAAGAAQQLQGLAQGQGQQPISQQQQFQFAEPPRRQASMARDFAAEDRERQLRQQLQFQGIMNSNPFIG